MNSPFLPFYSPQLWILKMEAGLEILGLVPYLVEEQGSGEKLEVSRRPEGRPSVAWLVLGSVNMSGYLLASHPGVP